jgi:hypothetical protein
MALWALAVRPLSWVGLGLGALLALALVLAAWQGQAAGALSHSTNGE